MTRRTLYALLVAGALLLAGCTGGTSGSPAAPTSSPGGPTATSSGAGSPTTGTAGTGTVDFYVSDEENAIADFAHVNVTVTEVGFQRGGESGGWVEHDVDNATVDLTELQGARSAYVDSYDLPSGEYTRVFVYVDGIHATLETGEEVRVKLPSEKLQLDADFAMENGSEVEFVFDVTVRKAGNSGKYVLQPVVTESGTDVPIERTGGDEGDEGGDNERVKRNDGKDRDGDAGERDSEDTLEATVEGNVSPGEDATLVVTRNGSPVENATVTVNGEPVGTTDAEGELTVAVPEADAVTLVVDADGDEVELEFEFE